MEYRPSLYCNLIAGYRGRIVRTPATATGQSEALPQLIETS